MENKFKGACLYKKIIFALLPLLILLFVGEVGARFMYFEKTGKNRETFALKMIYKQVKFKLLAQKASKMAGDLPDAIKIGQELYSPQGQELLNLFKKEYENNFKLLAQENKTINSKLAVLYIPDEYDKRSPILIDSREFFSDIAKKYGANFLDITDDFFSYPKEVITLLPEDEHISRFGNQIIAEKLSKYIDENTAYKAGFQFNDKEKTKRLGDLSPNDNTIWEYNPKMPYKVTVNKQGLRMDYDLTFPKQKQRVLILGASYTFGPYLNNHDTFPVLLNKKYPDKEIINAGIVGYSIADKVSLFIQRAKYAEPDMTILQVSDADLSGLFYFKINEFSRTKTAKQPSALEIEFLNKLK